MKCSVFVATFACILSATLAFSDSKVEQVQSEVMSYVQENLGGVRMMRGSSAHLLCYDDFIPLINRLAVEAKQNSQKCVDSAEEANNTALNDLKETRYQISLQVLQIQDSLSTCTKNSEGLEYFQCLTRITDQNKKTMDDIAAKSAALINKYGDMIRAIDEDEQNCLRTAVEIAKNNSDKAFDSLKACIAYGPTVGTSTKSQGSEGLTTNDWITGF